MKIPKIYETFVFMDETARGVMLNLLAKQRVERSKLDSVMRMR